VPVFPVLGWVVASVLIVLVPRATLAAQAPPLRLRPALDSLDHEFTRIGSVRELSDGRLLVSDNGERQLLLASFTSADVVTIGRRGAGPGEYTDLGELIALRGDTTIFSDQSNGRFALVHGQRIVATIPADDPFYARGGPQLIGASREGMFLKALAAFPANAGARYRLGVAAMLVPRDGSRADTLTALRGNQMSMMAVGPAGSGSMRTMSVIFASAEQATIFADGWIAVALQDPYRVDWYPPNAPARRGAAIEREQPPVTEAEKEAWMRAAEASMGRAFPIPKAELAWAEHIAPFRDGALVPLADGRLLLAKLAWSGRAEPEYDVVDRRGSRVGVLRLAKDERVVGTGARGLYVAAADEDGLQWLRVHPLP
jgi:hypothetical protein